MTEKDEERIKAILEAVSGKIPSREEIKKALAESRKFTDSLSLNTASLRDMQRNLISARKEVAELGKAAKNDTTKMAAYQQAKEALTATTKEYNSVVRSSSEVHHELGLRFRESGTHFRNAIDHTVDAFKNGLTASNGSITGSASVFNAAVGAASSALSSIGSAVGAAGAALSMLPHPATRLAGIIAMIGGNAVSAASEVARKLVSSIVGVLAPEVEKLIESYQRMTSAGLLLGGGMEEAREAALGMGLTVEQMSQVFASNMDLIARSGVGAQEAMHVMSNAIRSGGDDFKMRIRALGFDFAEMPELMAEVMADMRAAGINPVDNVQLTRATTEYARNLRLISSITGEDAKQRMAEARQRSTQLAVRNRLTRLAQDNPEIMTQYRESTAGLPAQMQRMIDEMLVFNNVVSQDLAAALGTSPELESAVRSITESIRSGQASAENSKRELAELSEALRTGGFERLDAIGIAGLAGHLTSLNDIFSSLVGMSDRVSPEAVENAVENLVTLTNTLGGELTESILSAQQSAQNLQIAIQEQILQPEILSRFASSLEAVNNVMTDFINNFSDLARQFANENNTPPERPLDNPIDPQRFNSTDWNTASMSEETYVIPDLSGYMTTQSSDFMRLLEERSNRPSLWNRLFSNPGYLGDNTNLLQPQGSYATGGIVNYPMSGASAVLHGREAVIPLGDGNTLTIDIPSMDQLAEEMTASVRANQMAAQQQTNELLVNSFKQLVSSLQAKDQATSSSTATVDILRKISTQMEESISVNRLLVHHVR